MLNVSANHLAKVETGSRCCSIELLQDLSSLSLIHIWLMQVTKGMIITVRYFKEDTAHP